LCGIIGYAGGRPALPVLLDGLKRLEYRGYDSSGVAVVEPTGGLFLHKGEGKLSELIATIEEPSIGTVGLGHTRWATHGRPSWDNAHPHTDCSGKVAVAHNGIIENHSALRARLTAEGHTFRSHTDTEIIPHLIENRLAEGATFEEAVRYAANQIVGASAIIALVVDEPDRLIGVRIGHAGGLAVGYDEDAMLLASDLPAMISHISSVIYLADREMAVITPREVSLSDLDGAKLTRPKQSVVDDGTTVRKGPYRHFMLKEIMEQPDTLMSAMRDRLDFETPEVTLPDFPLTAEDVKGLERVIVTGMGTSFHSAMVGRDMIETLARIPSHAENASEFRYRDPAIDAKTLVVSVAQSGETADTLAAMVEAKRRGAPQVTICNVYGSEATRIADYSLFINAGPEIAVASTKTLVGSILCLYMLATYLGQVRGTLAGDKLRQAMEDIVKLPNLLGEVVEREAEYEDLARRYSHASDFLILGRGVNYPTALEGALKLKEISYIHAEGYQAGEMKHGPIALIDENMPVVAIALKDGLYEKMLGNLEEVKARGGKLIAIVTEGDEAATLLADDVIALPEAPYLLSPILALAPLQLLSYHIAVRRGADVDQPRNLAKTVTVE